MKKIFTIIALSLALVAVSCKKEAIENTATVDMAGQWYVQYHGVDANGAIMPGFEDFNGGFSLALSFNTSANTPNELFLSDTENSNFLGYQVKVPCDLASMTFGTATAVDNVHPDSYAKGEGWGKKVTISNGKIMLQAAHTPSGMPADSIVFEIKLEGDTFAAAYGHDHYQVTGYRYTGLAADD